MGGLGREWRCVRRSYLIQAKEFRLPTRRDIYEMPDIEILVVDATESQIQRPKKNKENGTLARKRSMPLKHK